MDTISTSTDTKWHYICFDHTVEPNTVAVHFSERDGNKYDSEFCVATFDCYMLQSIYTRLCETEASLNNQIRRRPPTNNKRTLSNASNNPKKKTETAYRAVRITLFS